MRQLQDSSAGKVLASAWEALGTVRDPEIPTCSITDLGIVERVAVSDQSIEVELLPTFSGCPALDVIAQDVKTALGRVAGGRELKVRFVYSPAWTSERITPSGREALRSYGLTPPWEDKSSENRPQAFVSLASLGAQMRMPACPFCSSRDTALESAFGPTLCRSTHFCRSCRNPFEAFKPKTAQ